MNELKEINIWNNPDKLKEIREVLFSHISSDEFDILIGIGKATNLNPFLREIWAVKYGSGPANIFIGRDGYRKAAQSQAEYDFHYTECVCKNDEFEVVDGVISHKFKFADRGELLGAYCIVRKRHSSQSVYSIVDFKEYNKKQSVWISMPKVMIQKCAEAVALRMAFQGVFSGTYSEAEEWEDKPKQVLKVNPKSVIDVKPGPENKISKISTSQIASILSMIAEVELPKDRKDKALKYYDVSSIEQLNMEDADHFLQMLNNIKLEKRQAQIDEELK